MFTFFGYLNSFKILYNCQRKFVLFFLLLKAKIDLSDATRRRFRGLMRLSIDSSKDVFTPVAAESIWALLKLCNMYWKHWTFLRFVQCSFTRRRFYWLAALYEYSVAVRCSRRTRAEERRPSVGEQLHLCRALKCSLPPFRLPPPYLVKHSFSHRIFLWLGESEWG